MCFHILSLIQQNYIRSSLKENYQEFVRVYVAYNKIEINGIKRQNDVLSYIAPKKHVLTTIYNSLISAFLTWSTVYAKEQSEDVQNYYNILFK